MTDILPPAGWPNVRQLEINEFASGGANGNMNEQAKSLAARTELLKNYTPLPYESGKSYKLNERVQIATGDIVRSTIASNVNNPNVNMTGWETVEPKNIIKTVESIEDLMALTGMADGDIVCVKNTDIQNQTPVFLSLLGGIWTESTTGGFLQSEQTSVTRTQLSKSRLIQNTSDYKTPSDALRAVRDNTYNICVDVGDHAINSEIDISKYVMIYGSGDSSVIRMSGEGALRYITPTSGMFDDHVHRTIKDLRIVGDGTTTGFQVDNTGHYGSLTGLTFSGHAVGAHISRSYTCHGNYNYYRDNDIGLRLTGVTSFTESNIYARFNKTAGVLIEGAGTQNLTLNGGAIEGNSGAALIVRDLPTEALVQLTLNDVYMESNGDADKGVRAVDIQNVRGMHVSATGGNYWYNVLPNGKKNGSYHWGRSVSFSYSSLAGSHYADIFSIENTPTVPWLNTHEDQGQARLNGLTAPPLVTKYTPTNLGFNLFCTPFIEGVPPESNLNQNKRLVNYPYIFQASATVSTAVSAEQDYGDGTFVDLSVTPSGDFNNNYIELFSQDSSENSFYIKRFVAIPKHDISFGIVIADTSTKSKGYYELKGGVLYNLILVGKTSSATLRVRMFNIAETPLSFSFKPLLDVRFDSADKCRSYLNKYCL